mgnify:FL=1
MKTTTPSRDMRALQRQLVKIKNELVQTKRNAKRTRNKTSQNTAMLIRKLNATEIENKIMRNSFTNFTSTFNIQRKELSLLKLGLREIVENQKRNPYIVSKRRKTNI